MKSEFSQESLSDRFFKTPQRHPAHGRRVFSAYQVSLLGFLVMILLGTLLLFLPGVTQNPEQNHFLTALFQATSAVCVTGLSVVDITEYYNLWGQIVLLFLIQLGGLGYMTLYSLMLVAVGKRISLQDRLAIKEVLDLSGSGGAIGFVLRIFLFSLFFEALGALILFWRWMPQYGSAKSLYFAVFHSVSAFNNAGFALYSDSLMGFSDDAWILGVLGSLVMIGGLGFPILWELLRGLRIQGIKLRWHSLSFHARVSLLMTALFFFGGAVMYYFLESANLATLASGSEKSKLLGALFMSVMPRTAGFNALDIGAMTHASIFFTLSLMLVGANPGGTGGGIKTTTVVVILTRLWADLRGQKDALLMRRRLSLISIQKAWATLFLSLFWINLTTFLLMLSEQDLSVLSLLFETVSAFATVGLSTGITADLSVMGKLLIVMTMYIGRVGILSAAMAFAGQSHRHIMKYPEDNLMVG